MPRQIKITIPKPCHEKWEEMTPTQQGAYCQVCSKNVVDFTTKTENEIYDILTQSDGNTCGRFTSFQLQHPIRKTEINNGWFNWRALAASLAALVAFEETEAQSNKASICQNPVELDTVVVVGKKWTESHRNSDMLTTGVVTAQKINAVVDTVLHGSIVDEQGAPLQGAIIYLKSGGSKAVADWDGSFSLSIVPDSYLDDVIVVRYIGYPEKVVSVSQFIKHYQPQGGVIKFEPPLITGLSVIEVKSNGAKLKHRKHKLRK